MESKSKNIERLVKYLPPVILVVVLLGLYWVGSNSLVIATTVSTVDKELKGAYLERDAYNNQMKQEADRGDSLESVIEKLEVQSAIQDSIKNKKIDSLRSKLENEKKNLEAVVKDFRNYRDSVSKLQLKRSAVEDRYREE